MSSLTNSLRARLAELPQPMQWLTITVVGVVLFMLWDTTVRPLNDAVREEADRFERRVQTVRDASGLSRDLMNLEETIASIGNVDIPSSERIATNELQVTVNTILKKFPRINKDSFSVRPEGKLRRGALAEVARGRRIETIRGDLSFEAAPGDAVAVVAELEMAPAVERVTNLQFNRIGSGNLRVRLALESWVLGNDR